jgi:hypothetical protein
VNGLSNATMHSSLLLGLTSKSSSPQMQQWIGVSHSTEWQMMHCRHSPPVGSECQMGMPW